MLRLLRATLIGESLLFVDRHEVDISIYGTVGSQANDDDEQLPLFKEYPHHLQMRSWDICQGY
jgi:hypothetical protein